MRTKKKLQAKSEISQMNRILKCTRVQEFKPYRKYNEKDENPSIKFYFQRGYLHYRRLTMYKLGRYVKVYECLKRHKCIQFSSGQQVPAVPTPAAGETCSQRTCPGPPSLTQPHPARHQDAAYLDHQ